jgi:hypothetical protein
MKTNIKKILLATTGYRLCPHLPKGRLIRSLINFLLSNKLIVIKLRYLSPLWGDASQSEAGGIHIYKIKTEAPKLSAALIFAHNFYYILNVFASSPCGLGSLVTFFVSKKVTFTLGEQKPGTGVKVCATAPLCQCAVTAKSCSPASSKSIPVQHSD